MRTFDPRTVAAAAELTPKQFANLLSRINLDFGNGRRQGRRKRYEIPAAMLIDLIVVLGRMGIPAVDAQSVAASLVATGKLNIGPGLTLLYDPAEHRNGFVERMKGAAERVVARQRGRPPTQRRDRT